MHSVYGSCLVSTYWSQSVLRDAILGWTRWGCRLHSPLWGDRHVGSNIVIYGIAYCFVYHTPHGIIAVHELSTSSLFMALNGFPLTLYFSFIQFGFCITLLYTKEIKSHCMSFISWARQIDLQSLLLLIEVVYRPCFEVSQCTRSGSILSLHSYLIKNNVSNTIS